MGLKIKRPAVSTMSTKEDSEDDLDIGKEDLDISGEDDSSEDRNLLSDDSEIDQSDEESIHSSDDESVNNTEQKLMDNPAWADAMSKILKSKKPKRKKGIVLARAKKLNDPKAVAAPVEEKLGFEIIKNDQTEDAEVKIEVKQEPEIKEEKPDPAITLSVAQRRLLKKVWQSKGRIKPSALEKDREKALSKIATRGVITLFNAVRQQQKTLTEKLNEAGSLEVKRDKAYKSVNKKEFLDTLAERAKCENVDNPVKSESDSDQEMAPNKISTQANKTGKTWDVLRNNFMMGASMKDWDKEDEEEGETQVKKKVKPSDKSTDKKSAKSGGAKFSFSMDVDADYSDDDNDGGESDGGSGSDGDSQDDGDSDFSD
ncbi:hypothetical protein M8J75_011101 [Diaphorina citri]|nr:hypothetical protein M8J75_011101 [Diaphorina citri]